MLGDQLVIAHRKAAESRKSQCSSARIGSPDSWMGADHGRVKHVKASNRGRPPEL